MSRVSETNHLVDEINEAARDGRIDATATIAAFLGEIALSLATIADEIKEQEHECK